MTNKRFKKGQSIFEVSTYFSSIQEGNHETISVKIIKYTVDTCGFKKLTVENDYTSTHKSYSPSEKLIWDMDNVLNEKLHSTEEAAREAAQWYCENAEKEVKAWKMTKSYLVVDEILDRTIN